MTRLRLVATDLDGTLIRSDHTVSAYTADVLRRVRDAGVEIVALTARPPRIFAEAPDLAALLDLAVCANGAITYDLAAARVTGTREIAVPLAKEVVAALATAVPGVAFGVETGTEVVAESAYRRRDGIGDRHRIVPTVDDIWPLATPFAKLLAHSTAHHADAMLAAALPVVPPGVEMSHSGGRGLLEISAAGVTKAAALAELCAAKGIGAEEVAAFGDMPNDLPMLRWAGRAYAMANAHPDVLAAVAGRAAGNEEDGVARVLDDLLSPARSRRAAPPTAAAPRPPSPADSGR